MSSKPTVCVPRRRRLAVVAVLATICSCVSPPRVPIDPAELLEELRAIHLDEFARARDEAQSERADAPGEFNLDDGLSVDEVSAIALTWNLALRAARARAGIARAEVVVAGLFPDPQFGADLSDLGVLVSEKDEEGNVESVDLSRGPLDWVAGLDLVFPLPRPGELDARVGAAEARELATRADIARVEWRLVGEVRQAFLGVMAAEERVRLMDRLSEVVGRTHSFFERGREMGAATALEENLAAIELDTIRQRREGLLVERGLSRQRLNGLLGLPPETSFKLRELEDPFTSEPPELDAQALVDASVLRRPDLAMLLAEYEEAEQLLRLEVARRWPGLAVGTSISIDLPIFSGLNEPAIQLALKRRDQLRDEVRAAIHELRGEVHKAMSEWERVGRQTAYFLTNTEPRLRRSLELTDEAFRAREVNLLEALTAQRQVLDAQEFYLELRIAQGRAAVNINTVTAAGLPVYELNKNSEETP